MLLLENERYVIECTLALKPFPASAPNMPLRECIPDLIKLIDSGKAMYPMKKGLASLRIQDYKIDDNHITLLLQYADSNVSDPSFSKLKTGQTRREKKRAGEGIATTAHLILNLDPTNESEPHFYEALLEEVSGINKTNISSAITKFLDECTNFHFKNGNKKESKPCRPRFILELNAGHALEKILSKGWVTGFSAIRHITDNKLDEHAEFKIEEERITIHSKKVSGSKALEKIKKLAGIISDRSYSRLLVRHQDENKRQSTLNIDTREKDLATKIFSKSEKMILGDTIQQCEENIHGELQGKMATYLNKMIGRQHDSLR